MRAKINEVAISVASILAASGSPAVLAQQVEAELALEEVIVTAERKEAALQDTPLSIIAFSGDQIQELSAADPMTLANFTPNLSFGDGTGRGANGSQISIRGVSEARVSPVLDPAVGIYIDDVYYGRPQTSFLRLLDVERVEVLRGPQGTLFGKNSIGGAIRYVTQKPQFGGVDGYVQLGAGDYGRQEIKAAVNLPFSDGLALRLMGALTERDGYLVRDSDDVALGNEDTRFAMAQLRLAVAESLNVNLKVDYVERKTDDGASKIFDYWRLNNTTDIQAGGATGTGPGVGSTQAWNSYWGTTPRTYGPSIPDDLFRVAGLGEIPVMETESLGIALDGTWTISENLTIRSITGYRTVDVVSSRDPDDQANAFTFFDDVTNDGSDFWSQEFQVNVSHLDGRITWVGGLFYSEEKPYSIDIEDRDARSIAFRGALLLNDDARQKTESFGAYAQADFGITEKFVATLGVRYSVDDKSYTVSQVALWDATLAAEGVSFGRPPLVPPTYSGCTPTATTACVVQVPITGSDSFSAVTPRVALKYDFTDDIMAYVSASKGFKSGGTNDSVADINTPFDPEELWAYELGARTRFLANRLQVNATYFLSDYTDKQITVAASPNCANRCTENAGNAKIDGFEVDVLAQVTRGLQLSASVGTLDARWDEITNSTSGVSLNSWFSRAPDLSYTIGARYQVGLFGGNLVGTANYSYVDEQATSPQDSTTIFIPEYQLLTMRLAFTSPSGRWDAGVFCTNCADEEYFTGGAGWAGASDNAPSRFRELRPSSSYIFQPGGFGGSPDSVAAPGISLANIGAPRMWGVDFRYRFGAR
jgi:iron complex outermembrane receptor protein